MYLVRIPADGAYSAPWWMFFLENPIDDGCTLPVEGVESFEGLTVEELQQPGDELIAFSKDNKRFKAIKSRSVGGLSREQQEWAADFAFSHVFYRWHTFVKQLGEGRGLTAKPRRPY